MISEAQYSKRLSIPEGQGNLADPGLDHRRVTGSPNLYSKTRTGRFQEAALFICP
jgi:hypothetical protein